MKRPLLITLSASLRWIPLVQRLSIPLLLTGTAAGFLAICLVASESLPDRLGRYPGSIYPIAHQMPFSQSDRVGFQRQAAYQTPDDQALVLRWYVSRLNITPVWDLGQGVGCAWLARTESAQLVAHTTSVQLCANPGGTRILLYEALTFGW